MSKVPLFHHFTESLDEIHDFLKDVLKSDDVEVLDVGADIRVGDLFVEVKACQEYIKDNCSNGKRRHGRFHFQHPINADYVLFVLMKNDGTYEKRLISSGFVRMNILKMHLRTAIPFSEVFA